MIGNNEFGFELKKIENNDFEIKMIIDEINIMEYIYNNERRTTTWVEHGIIDFFVDNLCNIMNFDNYPFNKVDRIGIDMSRDSGIDIDWGKIDDGDEIEFEKAEKCAFELDSWNKKHNWFYYRNGAFIPDVTFRSVDDFIEISWDNSSLYNVDEIKYVNLRGFKLISKSIFEDVIKQLIYEYKRLL